TAARQRSRSFGPLKLGRTTRWRRTGTASSSKPQQPLPGQRQPARSTVKLQMPSTAVSHVAQSTGWAGWPGTLTTAWALPSTQVSFQAACVTLAVRRASTADERVTRAHMVMQMGKVVLRLRAYQRTYRVEHTTAPAIPSTAEPSRHAGEPTRARCSRNRRAQDRRRPDSDVGDHRRSRQHPAAEAVWAMQPA